VGQYDRISEEKLYYKTDEGLGRTTLHMPVVNGSIQTCEPQESYPNDFPTAMIAILTSLYTFFCQEEFFPGKFSQQRRLYPESNVILTLYCLRTKLFSP
jgi:hypothetical protein